MGKLGKYEEQARGYYPKKKERKPRRTKEEKEKLIEKFDRLSKHNIHLDYPSPTSKVEQDYDKKWEQQERELCVHSETFSRDGVLICRLCGETLKDLKKAKKGFQEKFMDLFCAHKNLEEFDDYKICLY